MLRTSYLQFFSTFLSSGRIAFNFNAKSVISRTSCFLMTSLSCDVFTPERFEPTTWRLRGYQRNHPGDRIKQTRVSNPGEKHGSACMVVEGLSEANVHIDILMKCNDFSFHAVGGRLHGQGGRGPARYRERLGSSAPYVLGRWPNIAT